MNRGEARKLLGLGALQALTPEIVRAAFAAGVKDAHPDTGMQPSGGAREAGFRIKELKEARDILLADLGTRPTLCLMCGGSGWVLHGFKKVRCGRGC